MRDPAAHWLAHAERLPILTEVVDIGGARPVSEPPAAAPPAPAPSAAMSLALMPPALMPPAQAIDATLLVEQVLAQVARQVDAAFEAQLRGALAPAVARAFGTLVADGHVALSASLRGLVEQAVARALAEQRPDPS